jgi:methionyl-tRNA formyltransferase
MEWSILKGAPPAVTVFFIDEGIDTGARIVLREDFALSGLRTIAAAKKYLLKQDATLYRRAIEMLAQPGFAFTPNNGGHRYYPMSNLFLGVVERLLAQTEMKPRNVTE